MADYFGGSVAVQAIHLRRSLRTRLEYPGLFKSIALRRVSNVGMADYGVTLLGIGVVNGIPRFSQVMSSGRNGTLQRTSCAKSKLLLRVSKCLPSRIFLRRAN